MAKNKDDEMLHIQLHDDLEIIFAKKINATVGKNINTKVWLILHDELLNEFWDEIVSEFNLILKFELSAPNITREM